MRQWGMTIPKHHPNRMLRISRTILSLTLTLSATSPMAAQGPGGPGPGPGGPPGRITALRDVPVPQPVGADKYIQDQGALIALGKALFWDMQAGSDGRTACATCHFHAGADHRRQNQLASPANRTSQIELNRVLTSGDFPFHQLANPLNNRSEVLRDTRQVAGSAGVFERVFRDILPQSEVEDGASGSGSSATLAGVKLRQVTARNTPSVINAVFNVRNFWDGRASSTFTGATPFGDSDPNANALVLVDGELRREAVHITNASLASQAVGPALNAVEMSYSGRQWPKLAKKMLALTALGRQEVSPDDSVLGFMANTEGKGLRGEYSYAFLIQTAFRPEYWSSPTLLDADGKPLPESSTAGETERYTQMELNFALFWGLAIQAYEATLVSDDTRVDRFLAGDRQALSAQEARGLQVFVAGGSQCLGCHQGAETTAASFTNVFRAGANPNNPGTHGFFRTGVTPLQDDIGLGGRDDFGQLLFALGRPGNANGTFKSPGLRNVEFTGPYFHDGGQATLEQVIDFYARNGDFPQGGNLGPGIGRINLNDPDARAALVAFLKALTDDRVRFERAPFDHPSICVPDGHAETSPGVAQVSESDSRFALSAEDKWSLVPAIGRGGNAAPLQTFEELLRGIGSDGSRAHAMNQACTP